MLWIIWFGYMLFLILWNLLVLVLEVLLRIWNVIFPLRRVDVLKVINYLTWRDND